jgi:hypothetical protein
MSKGDTNIIMNRNAEKKEEKKTPFWAQIPHSHATRSRIGNPEMTLTLLTWVST